MRKGLKRRANVGKISTKLALDREKEKEFMSLFSSSLVASLDNLYGLLFY